MHENVFTPYFQFNIDTNLGGISLRGNFGMQMQHTAQRASGERVAPGSAITGNAIELIPVTGSTSYTRYLPSANLIFGFTDNDDLRISAARTLSRPRMDQMNASLGVSGDITNCRTPIRTRHSSAPPAATRSSHPPWPTTTTSATSTISRVRRRATSATPPTRRTRICAAAAVAATSRCRVTSSACTTTSTRTRPSCTTSAPSCRSP